MKLPAFLTKFINDILTEIDGKSHDIMRFGFVLGSFSMIAMSLIAVVKSGAFSATDFGAGYGGLMAASGLGMGARAKGEGQASQGESGAPK